MKIDRRKNYYLVLDTETCDEITHPLVYDIGFVIADTQGNIYERRSYLVYEIFFGERELMKSAYYAEKIPMYMEDFKNKARICKRFFNIRKEIMELIDLYQPVAVCAYNAAFDVRALFL